MDIFISYARADAGKLRPLLSSLRRLGHSVWVDMELGGAAWWETVIEHVRTCNTLVLALSPQILEAEYCLEQATYARALGKPTLPVMIERVQRELLPPSIVAADVVDFTEPDAAAAFNLMAGLSQLAVPRPLPDRLPDPPPMPVSFLSQPKGNQPAKAAEAPEPERRKPRESVALRSASTSVAITGPVSYEIIETHRTQRVVGSDVRKIDNRRGDGTITRRMKISREWSQALSIGFEQLRVRSTTTNVDVKVGWKLEIQAGLKHAIEKHLKDNYSINVQDKHFHEEEVIVEVPGRTAQDLVLEWKDIRQHGFIRVQPTDEQPNCEIPFEVTVGLTFDIQ